MSAAFLLFFINGFPYHADTVSVAFTGADADIQVTPLPRAVPPPHLLHQLEILVCDSSTLKFRPCELALALLCTEFQQLCAKHPSNTTALMGFVTELQKYCNIQASHFVTLLSEVVAILERYNAEGQVDIFDKSKKMDSLQTLCCCRCLTGNALCGNWATGRCGTCDRRTGFDPPCPRSARRQPPRQGTRLANWG